MVTGFHPLISSTSISQDHAAKLNQQPGTIASIFEDLQNEMDWDRTYTKDKYMQHHMPRRDQPWSR